MKEFNDLLDNYTEGKTLPQEFYTNENIFAEEMKRIYHHQWLLVDHISRIPNPGDYFLFDAGKESIIVIRGKDLQVRAFYNVCTHRGSRICLEEEGSKKLLVCPYHAWSFTNEGKLQAARYMPDDFNREDWGLRPCHIKIYQGLIFLNLSITEPINFEEFIKPLQPMLEMHQPGTAKIALRKKYPTAANFKLVIENFTECYHCGPSHPELCAIHEKDWVYTMGGGQGTAPEKDTEEYLKKIKPWIEDCRKRGLPTDTYLEEEGPFKQGINRYADRTPIGNGHLSQTKDGKPASTLMGKFDKFDGGLTQVSFNPFGCCYFTNDFGIMFAFKPKSINETEVELIWLVNQDAKEDVDYKTEDIQYIWDVTTVADTRIIENNQSGLLSQVYTPGVLSRNESGITYLYNWYFNSMRLSR
tara:strand:- start:7138 stop:8379 length:1242 start_codon:yes stop_codon:yes gene_type:complete